MIGTEVPFVVAPEVPACPGAWPRAPGRGIGGGEDGGAVGGAPRSPPRRDLRPQTAPGMPRAPDLDAEAGASCGRSSPRPEPGAGRWRAEAAGAGTGTTKRAARPPALLDWACKELKKNIFMCGFFGRGSESLLVFRPLHSLGITRHTVKDNICAEPCVCV